MFKKWYGGPRSGSPPQTPSDLKTGLVVRKSRSVEKIMKAIFFTIRTCRFGHTEMWLRNLIGSIKNLGPKLSVNEYPGSFGAIMLQLIVPQACIEYLIFSSTLPTVQYVKMKNKKKINYQQLNIEPTERFFTLC